MNLATMAVKTEIVPAPDNDLAIWDLLDADRFARQLVAAVQTAIEIVSCSVTYVRYKPGEDCIASFAVAFLSGSTTEPVHTQFYLKGYPPESFAAARASLREQEWCGGRILCEPVAWEPYRAIVFEFPDDARLSGLRHLADTPALKKSIWRQLESIGWVPAHPADRYGLFEALRYKPESRFVAHLACDSIPATPGVTVRVESPRRAAAQFDHLRVLAELLAGHEMISMPRPLFVWDADGLLVQEWIEAVPLSGLMRGGAIDTALVTAATALVHFHRLPPGNLPAVEWAAHRVRLERWVRSIGRICPTHRDIAAAILKRLGSIARRVESSRPVAVHGDFHQGQLLYNEQRIWFLDLEGVYAGEPEADIGNFTAQLLLQEARGRIDHADDRAAEFVEHYRAEGGSAPDARRLKMWTAIGLLNLAAKQCRRLRAGWQDTGAALLSRAASILGVS